MSKRLKKSKKPKCKPSKTPQILSCHNTRRHHMISTTESLSEVLLDADVKPDIKPLLTDLLVVVKQENEEADTKENIMPIKEEPLEVTNTTYGDGTEIDTEELAEKIQIELKRLEIPQFIFAKCVLHRTQGTLSDLLRRPIPWSKLRSGRHTYQRMFNWLKLSDNDKTLLKFQNKKIPKAASELGSKVRKQKLIFTDMQKKTLQAIFKADQHPSKTVIQIISQQLDLQKSTIQNYFTNARRRSKLQDENLLTTKSKMPKLKPKHVATEREHVTGD